MVASILINAQATSPEQLHEQVDRVAAQAPELSQASLQTTAARVSGLAATHAEDRGSLGWLPSHHFFLAANFYAHAIPHGLILLLILLRICVQPSEKWQPALRRALAKGFSRPTVALMQFYQYLTSCTHALGIVYLALSLQGGKPIVLAAARAVLFPWATFVGVAWSLLCCWSPTRSLRPPWTMLPRNMFPKDDATSAKIARQIICWPTLGPFLPVFMLPQLQHVAMPLLPWVEAALYPEVMTPLLSLRSEAALVATCSAAWAGFSLGQCWHALGQAPYPVSEAVWREGSWKAFYAVTFAAELMMVLLGYWFRGGSIAM